MIKKTLVVQNRAGIHARPAAMICEAANRFATTEVTLLRDDAEINAKSVLGIITMGAAYKTEVVLVCDGDEEEAAAAAISRMFDAKFEED